MGFNILILFLYKFCFRLLCAISKFCAWYLYGEYHVKVVTYILNLRSTATGCDTYSLFIISRLRRTTNVVIVHNVYCIIILERK